MERKNHTLRFRASNREIFDAIRLGSKEVETRAATERYVGILKGDSIRFVCGKVAFTKLVKNIRHFRSIGALLKRYTPRQIHPGVASARELRALYMSFPGYREKIKMHGLVAIELI